MKLPKTSLSSGQSGISVRLITISYFFGPSCSTLSKQCATDCRTATMSHLFSISTTWPRNKLKMTQSFSIEPMCLTIWHLGQAAVLTSFGTLCTFLVVFTIVPITTCPCREM